MLKRNNKFIVLMKQSRSCYTCQRHFYNLMNANCGHKICFNCIKSNRNTNKCSNCTAGSQSRPRSSLHSPIKNTKDAKNQSSTKAKDSESKLFSQHSYTPQRKQSYKRQQVNFAEGGVQNIITPYIKCKQHHQPLSMYSKSTKDLVCSVCICSKAKLIGDVVPLSQAEQHLKKQNRLNKEQAKVMMTKIEYAQRLMNKNIQVFENSYKSGLKTLEAIFQQMKNQILAVERKLKQQFMSFFENKFKQCDQITQDLRYLYSVLKEYKENQQDTLNFKQLVYMFTSFKLIKGTIRNLDIDYVPYLKDINLVEINKFHYKDTLREFVKLKLNIPLKFPKNKKSKSRSIKSVSRSKNEEWDQAHTEGNTLKLTKDQRPNIAKKHQMSLCSNVHGIEFGQQQKNLYKLLLKTKFKL